MGVGIRNSYADAYQSFGQNPRQLEAGLSGFDPAVQAPNDPFTTYSQSAFGAPGLMDYAPGNNIAPSAVQRAHPQSEWVSRFQGLSLGS